MKTLNGQLWLIWYYADKMRWICFGGRIEYFASEVLAVTKTIAFNVSHIFKMFPNVLINTADSEDVILF